MRSGLSPAAISSAAALSGPTPWAARSAGLVLAPRRRLISTSSSAISAYRGSGIGGLGDGEPAWRS